MIKLAYDNLTGKGIEKISGDIEDIDLANIVIPENLEDYPASMLYVENGEVILNQQLARLQQINDLLIKLDSDYKDELQVPILYTNGKSYKGEYLENYYRLLVSNNFPKDIWDISKLENNKVSMTKDELVDLTSFIETQMELVYQEYKQNKSDLLSEKQQIESTINNNN